MFESQGEHAPPLMSTAACVEPESKFVDRESEVFSRWPWSTLGNLVGSITV